MTSVTVRAAAAAHMPSVRSRFAVAEARCAEHINDHGGYVAWSGGKDSTVVAAMATAVRPDIPVVFYHSGLEYPENVDYMTGLAEQRGWNFHTIHANPTALDIMASTGGWDHDAPVAPPIADLHDALITRPAAEAADRFGNAHLWGLRADESAGRRALLSRRDGTIVRAKTGQHVTSPIWTWNDLAVWAYLHANDIPMNPVYTRLEALGANDKDLRVGLAFDANNLANGRVTWLRHGWPALYDEICAALPRVKELR